MRIGLVLDDTLDTPDGVQQYMLSVGGWLTSEGHEVHYIVGKTTRTDIANIHSLSRNVSVKFNGNRMSVPLPASRRALRHLFATYDFDVIHVQVPYSPFLAGRLLRLVPTQTAVIGTFHILPYSKLVRLANRFLALLNHVSGKRFDQMLAVSEPARVFAEAIYKYKNMQVVPNPVRLAQFAGASSEASDINIVFLGRLVERKGAQLLLAAVAELKKRSLYTGEFHVVLGGKGALLDSLENFVAQNDMASYVTFAGFIDETSKPAFLAQADIAVFPSTSGESFGIVLLEAMAAARGVVLGGNNPGYSSVMHTMPEQLFDPTDVAAFAEKLAYWLQQAQARSNAGNSQKEYVKQFDIAVVGNKLVQIYEQALQSRQKT